MQYSESQCSTGRLVPAPRTKELATADAPPATLLEAVPELVERIFNALVALVLILLTLPLSVLVALVIFLAAGPPVLYLGRRLGRYKRPFTMVKFRTLTNGASSAVGGQILSHADGLAIPCGKFLRDTRLDELPQLLNILKGDMNLFGPRPERHEVYESLCRHVDGYDRRFAVKPGLIGASQLFTPHGAPKRLRAFIDNRVSSRKSPLRGVLLVVYAALAVGRTAVERLWRPVGDGLRSALAGRRNGRKLRRRHPRRATIRVATSLGGLDRGGRGAAGPDDSVEAAVVDINMEAICFHSPERLANPSARVAFSLDVKFRRRWRSPADRVRTARGTAEVSQVRQTARGWAHVINFEPAGESSRYVIDQYLLHGSLTRLFRP